MVNKTNSDIFVAGLGAISAIGNDVAECLYALENRQAGIAGITYLETVHRQQLPVAEVKLSNEELALRAGVSPKISRTALLSLLAARAALDHAGINNEGIGDAGTDGRASWRTGFVSANTVGGMDKTEQFFADFLSDPLKGKLRDTIQHECGSITEWVADQLHIRDYMTTISTACSSSANAIFFGARLIRHGLLDVVVAGGTDALTKFTLNGFNTLMILDQQACKPFDENRKGLNLGEGAGYVVLVSARVADSLRTELVCRLSGYCNANDAYHQTASSPDGTGSYLAMKGALERSGLQPSDIGYINLHGTGTQNNDIAEGTAIRRLFDPLYPPMSSTKSFTGHTLGACGGLEAVFSALSVQQGLIYPNLRFETPMKELPFTPVTTFMKDQPVRHVLSNSFGFGGNCSSLIFSKL
ncbi:MAG TPA: beta-ketoacyl-[acyl-carrier-protein] synthase family protein [Puia sp.]